MTEPIALVHEDRSWTRVQIEALAAGPAARLARRGVQPGERVTWRWTTARCSACPM